MLHGMRTLAYLLAQVRKQGACSLEPSRLDFPTVLKVQGMA